MIYTELTMKAMRIAFKAHKNQRDKSGVPYIFHPIHVAEQMKDEVTTIVALLHDVVEDADLTFSDLSSEGFSSEVLEALKMLTHDYSVPYKDYIIGIKSNTIATAVKLADLRHNCDLSRLLNVDEKAMKRVEKYKRSIEILEDK